MHEKFVANVTDTAGTLVENRIEIAETVVRISESMGGASRVTQNQGRTTGR